MKAYIMLKQQKNRLQNTKQLELQQKYSLGTPSSNIKLLGVGGGGLKPVLQFRAALSFTFICIFLYVPELGNISSTARPH